MVLHTEVQQQVMARRKKIRKIAFKKRAGILAKVIKKDIKLPKKELKHLAKKAHQVPSSLRFGIIVAMAIFWVDFIKQMFIIGFEELPVTVSSAIGTLIAAVIVTLIGFIVLESYPRIRAYLK